MRIGDFAMWELVELWNQLYREHRWRRTYRRAVPVNGVPNLYLSVCESRHRPRVLQSTISAWNQIPSDARQTLQNHWQKLQHGWDERSTGIRLRLPIFGVFESGFDTADEFGRLIGRALSARERNGFWDDSGDDLMRQFAGIHLVLLRKQLQLSNEHLEAEIGRRMGNYLLWTKERADQSDYVVDWHDGTDDLVRSWGFDMDIPDDY